MPMEQFLSIEGNALPPVDDDLTKAYQAQCWVLVHYLLFDRGAESAAQVGRYLSLCGRMPAPGAFAQAFGTPLENMKENLRRYMHGKIQRVTRVKFDRAKISQDFKLSAASAVEVEAAKGYVLLLNGDHDGARTYFERAKAQSPDDPKPLEALGDLALLSGDLEEAGRKWEAAAGAGSRNFNVYFQLAMALIRGNPGFTSGRAGDINPQLARKVANYLERAINLNPYYIQSFTYLPLVLGYYAEPTAEDPRFLELGLQLRPGDPLLEAGLAAVAVKAGRVDEARQRLARLTAADRTTPSAATALANSVQTRLQFADDLNQVEVLIADKKLEEAERLITTLLRAPMPAEIRLKLGQRLTDLGGWQVLQQVDRAMAEARWADAEILVRSLAESAPDPSLQAQAKTRLEEIIRQRAGKKI
jgi:Flp pilus assembly protein TadD